MWGPERLHKRWRSVSLFITLNKTRLFYPEQNKAKLLISLGQSHSFFINKDWTNGKGDFELSHLEGDLSHLPSHYNCLKVQPVGHKRCGPRLLYSASQTQSSCLYHLTAQNQPHKLLLLSLALWDIDHTFTRISISLAAADIVPMVCHSDVAVAPLSCYEQPEYLGCHEQFPTKQTGLTTPDQHFTHRAAGS